MEIFNRTVARNIQITAKDGAEIEGKLTQKTTLCLMVNAIKNIVNTVLGRTSGTETGNVKFTGVDAQGNIYTEKFNMSKTDIKNILFATSEIKISDKKTPIALQGLEKHLSSSDPVTKGAAKMAKEFIQSRADNAMALKGHMKTVVGNARDIHEGSKILNNQLQQLQADEKKLAADLAKDNAGLTADELAQVDAEFKALASEKPAVKFEPAEMTDEEAMDLLNKLEAEEANNAQKSESTKPGKPADAG